MQKGLYSVNKSTILLKTTKVFLISSSSSPDQSNINSYTDLCSLRWKHKILWVNNKSNQKNYLAALENLQWLNSCLKHSCANLVCIELSLGEAEIIFWANSCMQSRKPIFVRSSSQSRRLKQFRRLTYRPLSRTFKFILDRMVAAFLLLLLSPFLLVTIVLMKLISQDSIFSRKWRIGKRGRLFQAIQFRSISEDIQIQYHNASETRESLCSNNNLASFRLWMQKYGLDKIPQLMNVLRGEMSIVGPQALTLYEAIQIDSKYKLHLFVLPGIIGLRHQNCTNLSDIDQIFHFNFEYLNNWSLWKDTRILLKAMQNYLLHNK
jgi:lipopolysaccharide/colanic/teichoic acid biosynthesis glycosyltransferase